MDTLPDRSKSPPRRWFQFGLRTLLLVLAVAAVVTGWQRERLSRWADAWIAYFSQPPASPTGKDNEFVKTRWSQITIRYASGKRTRDEAWRLAAQCGNAILAGAKFEAMAQQYSDEPLVATDQWRGPGSLVSAAAHDLRLPVGTLSPIIEDGGAFHIIRVENRR